MTAGGPLGSSQLAVLNKKVKTIVILVTIGAVICIARSPSSPSLSSLFETTADGPGFAGFEFVRLSIAALVGFAIYAAASLLLELHSDEMLYHKEVEIVKKRKPSSLPKCPVENIPDSINPQKDLAGKNIFLTGVTGFVGKIVLEKLLRDAPDVKAILVLVRSPSSCEDRREAVQARFVKDVIDTPVFKVLKEKFGNSFNEYWRSRVVVIAGDLDNENLNLSDDDRQKAQGIDVIIHCAANTRFDDPVRKMVESNVLGTLNVLSFAKTLPTCPPISYVSTAYCNSNLADTIFERQYPLKFDAYTMAKAIINCEESAADTAFASALEMWPNQYTFSKALAEACLFQARGDVRVAVVRPTVIGPTLKEPFPGWIDTIFGAGTYA